MQPTIQHIAEECLIYPYSRLTGLHHLHKSFEIAVPRSGRLRALLDEREYILQPGEVLVIFPGVPHYYDPDETSEGMMIMFSDSMLSEREAEWSLLQPAEPVVELSALDRDVSYCLQRLMEMGASGRMNETLARAYLSLMFVWLGPALKPEEAPRSLDKDLLYRAMHYMSHNLAAPLSLRGTARALGVNNYYLSHVLNERLHMGFRAYLNALRIDRARRYLRVTNRSIEEIAAACGFANLRTFDRVFVERCGCTPRDFRKTAAALRLSHSRQEDQH